MPTVDDFAQGMLREYSTFAGQCAAIAAAPGDEATAAELFAMEDLPLIVEQLRSFRTRAEAAEQRAEAAEAALVAARAALKQAQDDGRLMLAHLGIDMWRRLDGAGRTRLEQELDSSLRNSTEDDGERVPYDELYAYRRLLMLGDFFDNPRRASPPVPALPEPDWYTEREAEGAEGE